MNGWFFLLSFLLGAAVMWFSIVRRVEVEVVDDGLDDDGLDDVEEAGIAEREPVGMSAGASRASGRPGAGGRPVVAPPTVDDDFFADDADVYGPAEPAPRPGRAGTTGVD